VRMNLLPPTSRLQITPDLNICRILNGLWQVSGGHGAIDKKKAILEMFSYVDAGFTTFDLADIYGPAEDFIGVFRDKWKETRSADSLYSIQAFTKWVPRPGKMTRRIVEDSINISLQRMHVETLDLLQFHWWDYDDVNYLDALKHLADLQAEGKIKHLALTNFDTEHMKIIIDNGIKIISNQVQYSIIDRRPEVKMAKFCEENGIKLFTYGTVCGGLLSDKFIGAPEPSKQVLNTASLKKYKNMIDNWGGWPLFQNLLITLKPIAEKHKVSIANVAVRFILDKPVVGGVIIGTKLGVAQHLEENAKVFSFALDADDNAKIDAISKQSRDLFSIIGDCGDEYRK